MRIIAEYNQAEFNATKESKFQRGPIVESPIVSEIYDSVAGPDLFVAALSGGAEHRRSHLQDERDPVGHADHQDVRLGGALHARHPIGPQVKQRNTQ